MILGFMDQFLPMVLDGSKQHSIRNGNRWRIGMMADLFARPRQKEMLLLFRAPVFSVESIVIREAGDGYCGHEVLIEGERLDQSECDNLAWSDGFRSRCSPCDRCDDWSICQIAGTCQESKHAVRRTDGRYGVTAGCFETMMRFWTGRLPFSGQIVYWDYQKRTNVASVARIVEFCKLAFGKRMSLATVDACVPEAIRAFGLERYIQDRTKEALYRGAQKA